MPKWESRIQVQGGLKLLNCLDCSIRVLISAAKQYVRKRIVWFEFDRTFQRVGCLGILVLIEKH